MQITRHARVLAAVIAIALGGCATTSAPRTTRQPSTPTASSAPSSTPAPGATIDAVLTPKGDVAIQPAGETTWTPAEDEVMLSVGDGIRTGAASTATLRFQDGSIARINAESTLVLAALSDDEGQSVSLQLVTGEVWSRVQQLAPGGSFDVRTPTTLALVRGTEFNVSVDAAGETVVETLEHSVDVATIETDEDGTEILSPQGSVEEGREARITLAMMRDLAEQRVALRAAKKDPRIVLRAKLFAPKALDQTRMKRAWILENQRAHAALTKLIEAAREDILGVLPDMLWEERTHDARDRLPVQGP